MAKLGTGSGGRASSLSAGGALPAAECCLHYRGPCPGVQKVCREGSESSLCEAAMHRHREAAECVPAPGLPKQHCKPGSCCPRPGARLCVGVTLKLPGQQCATTAGPLLLLELDPRLLGCLLPALGGGAVSVVLDLSALAFSLEELQVFLHHCTAVLCCSTQCMPVGTGALPFAQPGLAPSMKGCLHYSPTATPQPRPLHPAALAARRDTARAEPLSSPYMSLSSCIHFVYRQEEKPATCLPPWEGLKTAALQGYG